MLHEASLAHFQSYLGVQSSSFIAHFKSYLGVQPLLQELPLAHFQSCLGVHSSSLVAFSMDNKVSLGSSLLTGS